MKSINFKKIAFVAAWVASLLFVSQWGHSQTPQAKHLFPSVGTVISGNEIGFRFQGLSDTGSGGVTGQWLVKINGGWMPVLTPGATAKPLTAK